MWGGRQPGSRQADGSGMQAEGQAASKPAKKKLTYKEQQALQLMGGHAPRREDDLYVSYLRVLDFITGMTDQYASFVSTQFLGTSC